MISIFRHTENLYRTKTGDGSTNYSKHQEGKKKILEKKANGGGNS